MKFKFTPSETFAEDAKRKFLAVFDARYPAKVSWLMFAMRMAAAAIAIAAIVTSGATVYADAANVPADSPLYPFKRLGENVQLAVAPQQEDASLQASFAARRVAEINDLQNRKPTSTMIAQLSKDADEAVDASIAAADKTKMEGGQLTALCTQLLSALVPTSTIGGAAATTTGTAPGLAVAAEAHEELHGNLNALDRFTRQCEGVSSGTVMSAGSGEGTGTAQENDNGKNGAIAATSGQGHAFIPSRDGILQSTSTFGAQATSGVKAFPGAREEEPSIPEVEARIRTYLQEHLYAPSSTGSATTTNEADLGAIMELHAGGQRNAGGQNSQDRQGGRSGGD